VVILGIKSEFCVFLSFWKIDWWIMKLDVELVFWCVSNVPFKCTNYGWCLYNYFGTIEIKTNGILEKFWEGFPSGNPFSRLLGTKSLLGEHVPRGGELCRTTCVVLCVLAFWGCFRTSLSVPYVMIWCCFDELNLCNHACFKLSELFDFETNLYHNMNMNLD